MLGVCFLFGDHNLLWSKFTLSINRIGMQERSPLAPPLPLKGGEGKGEGAMLFRSRFMERCVPKSRLGPIETHRQCRV
jgi:hypothetical protein